MDLFKLLMSWDMIVFLIKFGIVFSIVKFIVSMCIGGVIMVAGIFGLSSLLRTNRQNSTRNFNSSSNFNI